VTAVRRLLPLLCALLLLAGGPAEAASSRVLVKGPDGAKRVALTFDDGWSLEQCRRIVGTLRAHKVTATFFINGMHLRRQPAEWKKILHGFPVANHSISHPNLARISQDDIRKQIAGNERIHERVLGREMLKILRPPYGAYDSDVLRVAGALGYPITLLWDTTAADSDPRTTTATVLRNATRGGPGSVVLMHCGPWETASALDAVIRSYKARGYRLVGLDELLFR